MRKQKSNNQIIKNINKTNNPTTSNHKPKQTKKPMKRKINPKKRNHESK